MKLNSATGLFFCLLLTSTFVSAQQPVTDTLNLKGVEVTGQKPPANGRSATPLQRLERKDISAMSGISVADALRNFSGVTIKDYGGLGGLKTVVVRSLGANHTGIFIDGAPMGDAATGQIDLSKLPLEDLEVIELYIGQGQQLCQPARAHASANMLSFQSLEPDFTHTNLHLKAGIKAGSFGVINPFAGIYFKAGKKTTAGFSADYNNTRGNYPYTLKNGNLPDTTLMRSNADIEALNLNLRIETRFSDSSLLKVVTRFYGSERGLPGAVIFYNSYSSQRLSNQDIFANVQYSRQQGKLDLLSNLNFSNSFLRYRDPAFLNGEGGLDNRYQQQEFYLSQALSMPLKGIFSLGAAADLIVNSLQTDLYTQGNPMRFTGLGSISLQAKTGKTETVAVILATLVNDLTPDNNAIQRAVLSPSFSFITRLSSSPVMRLRLMYKNSFRMPTFNDLYYNLVGNDQLKPEYVNQLNLGLMLSEAIGALQLSLHTDVFANRVKDKIVAVPTQNLFIWSMRNLGRVDIRGIEIQAGAKTSFRKSTDISLNLNYTHQQAFDMSVPGSPTYKQQVPYVPFQTFSGMLTLGSKRLTFGYNLLYNSHLYTLGENIQANLLPSWWIHDFAISWKQPVKANFISLKAEVVNLFNNQYEVIRGFPMNGRGFYLTLSINH
jgi:outer membrane cobalamin receptor